MDLREEFSIKVIHGKVPIHYPTQYHMLPVFNIWCNFQFGIVVYYYVCVSWFLFGI